MLKANASTLQLSALQRVAACICGLVLALALAPAHAWAAGPWSYDGNTYATLQDAVAAVPDGESAPISLTGNVDETTPVTIGANKDITLDLGGNTVNVSLSDTSKTFITTQANSTLTVKNGIFQGNQNGRAISASGKLDIDGATFSNFTFEETDEREGIGGGAIAFQKGAQGMVLNSVFRNNKANWCGGALSVADSTTVVVKQSQFEGNETTTEYSSPSLRTGGLLRDGGGAICVYVDSNNMQNSLLIDECTFKNNTSPLHGGAVFVSWYGDATITNSVFESNTAYFSGGAIGGYLVKDVVLEGNTIQENTAAHPNSPLDNLSWRYKQAYRYGYGGGVCLYTEKYNKGSDVVLASVTLKDNVIENNTAHFRGGGLSLAVVDQPDYQAAGQPKLVIEGKLIVKDNKAQMGAGIDTTIHNQVPLKLNNALITNNTAVRGGGIWLCQDGSLAAHSTLGGEVVGNNTTEGVLLTPITASRVSYNQNPQYDSAGRYVVGAAASDILNEGFDSTDIAREKTTGSVSIAMYDALGNPIKWYADPEWDRYKAGNEVVAANYCYDTEDSFYLHREPTGPSKPESEYDVVIAGNIATQRGGGIASNSPIQMGEEADTGLYVKKAWTMDPHPASAQFNLYREANGERELVETVTVNEANNWEHWFAGLPAYSIDSNGVRTNYTWSYEEVPMAGWAATRTLDIHQEIDEDWDTGAVYSTMAISGTAEPNTTKKFAFYVSDNGGDPHLYCEPVSNKDAEFTVATDASGNWTVDGSDVPLWAVEFDEDWEPIKTFTYTFMEWDEDAGKYVPVFKHDYQWDPLDDDESDWGTKDYTMVVNAPVEPIEETIPITKKVEGNPPADETFTFTIKAASEGAPMPANTQATIKGAGTANFGPIKFEQVGTYVYTVTETAGATAGYTYDPSTYTVTYKVTLDGTTLSATRTITKDGDALPQDTASLEFTNTYTPVPTQVVIPVTKTISGAEPAEAETFAFELSAEDENTPLSERARMEITGPGEGEFGPITFEKPGKYTYEVKEEPGTAAGYTYDDTVYTVELDVYEDKEEGALKCAKPIIHEGESPVTEIVFNNTYTIESTTVAGLQVAKTVEGETPAADAEFVFVLEPAEGEDTNPMPEEANEGPSQLISVMGAGTEYFGDITFEKAGTYHYTVREINTEAAGYTYDDTVYTVTYTVVANHKTAQLEASAVYEPAATRGENGEDALAFTNTYTHVPNTADGIKVRKHVSGDEPEHALDFTFELRPNEADNPMPGGVEEGTVSLTIHGAEEGAFKPIRFEDPGTYSYTIVETGEAPTGYTFDPAIYVVTYHVVPGEEELGIEWTITKDDADLPQDTASLEFTNTFTHTPTQVVIPVTKTISGAEPESPETFTFELSAEDKDAPLPELARIEITGPGKGEFGSITSDKPGTYTYEIEEVPGTATGYTYDNSVHEVTVTVEEQNGVLQAELSYARDGQQAEGVTFENKYTAPSTPVDVVLVKHLLNARINKGEFSFGLYDEAGERHGEIIHTVLEGTLTRPDTDKFTSYVEIAFEDLIYSEPGEYFYSIREHMDGTTEVVEGDEWNQAGFEPGFYKGGVKYDDKEYPVVVTVLENEEGKLEASVAYPGSSNAVELVNEYNEEYIEIDDNDEHRNNGLHEEPEEPDTPTPQPKPDPKPNPGPSPEPKVDTPTTAAPTPQATPKAGSARTEDTNPVAPLATLALLASGTAGFAFARFRRSKN